jgi:hypothetical protein
MKPTLKLIGEDGNAVRIMGRACRALQKAGMGDKVKEFMDEAMSGDYNHVLNTCRKYFEVE